MQLSDIGHAQLRRRGVIAIALISAVAVAATGSSSSAKAVSKGAGKSPVAATAAYTPGGANPNKVYARGVPTLNQLYKFSGSLPPSTGPKIQKGKTVVFVSCGQSAPGCAGPPNEMAKVAKLVGWKYSIADGMLDVNNGYETAFDQAVAEKPDAIVVHGINCQDVKTAFEQAKAEHVPVFAIESADCNDPDNPGGPSAPLFTAGDMYFNKTAKNAAGFFTQWGELQAAYVIDATKGHAKVIQTVFQAAFGAHQAHGQDIMLAKCKSCKIIDKIPWVSADGVPDGPLSQKFTSALIKYPRANAVITNYDTDVTTAGLSKDVVNEGRAKSMIVMGGEGYADAKLLIKQAQGLTADEGHSGNEEAWAAVDELNRFFHHDRFVPEGIGFQAIDKGHNLNPVGQNFEPPFNYQAIYEKSWGIKK